MSLEEAATVVKGWLNTGGEPLGSAMGMRVRDVEGYHDQDGTLLFYVVMLNPAGVVLVAADDRLEPIVSFASGATFEFSENNPWFALVLQNMQMQRARLDEENHLRTAVSSDSVNAKWKLLEELASEGLVRGVVSVDDERVAPFIQTAWNQRTYHDGSQYQSCYNYYTPPYGDGVESNYPAGCVATAYAQLMKYYEWPLGAVGTGAYEIEIEGVPVDWNLRGGNDAGGAYLWDTMPLDPDGTTTEAERQAIGRICHDAGLVAGMSYSVGASVGYLAPTNLMNVFNYGNAVRGLSDDRGFWNMLNANLDAHLPVPLSISGSAGGHLVLCDGYGYNLGTRYHHLNMGWGGNDDAWYNLPDVDAYYDFTNVNSVIYNIYTNGSGELISGRILNADGSAMTGAVVRVVWDAGTNVTGSGRNGIYCFTNVPSDEEFEMECSDAGSLFVNRWVSTGTSEENGSCGNLWGVNFHAQPPGSNIIAGRIMLPSLMGLSNVAITASGGRCVTSDVSGYYIFTVPSGWSGSVMYEKAGMELTPPSRSYTALSSNCIREDVSAVQFVYVNNNATGSDDGLSWLNAYTNLNDALDAEEGSAVLVAQGTYFPGQNRTDSFSPSSGIRIYGGFCGTETSVTQQNSQTYTTILSGDVGLAGVQTDNCYHVVDASDNVLLSGFTIRDGCADSTNSLSAHAYGGGAYCNFASEPVFERCVVISNYARFGGGLYYGIASNCIFQQNAAIERGGAGHKVRMVNCLVYSNYSGQYSGANMWGTNVNCTIVQNTAASRAGALYGCQTINSIVWDNSASSPYHNYWTGDFTNSCTDPLPSSSDNLNVDPLFVGVVSNDYRLQSNSPCVNQGSNAYACGDKDLLNNPRIWNMTVDMGAYEAAYLSVQALAGDHGSVMPAGLQAIYRGDSCTFTNTGDLYYHVGDVQVNGSSMGVYEVFVSSNILEAQTVTVFFAENVVTNVDGHVPEWWLASYGWTNDFETVATGDQDADSMLTWQEYVAGTVPTNTASVFDLECLNGAESVSGMRWSPCISNRNYLVLCTTNLLLPFTNVATLNYPVNAYSVLVEDVHIYLRVGVEEQ